MDSKSEVDGAPAPATDSLKAVDTATPLAKTVETIEKVTASSDTQNNGSNEPTVASNADTVNTTRTTVTVNISQTKVVVDGTDKEQAIAKTTAAFGTIAADAINAVEKAEKVKPAADTSADASPDIDMAEANDDIEMVEPSESAVSAAAAAQSSDTAAAAVEPDSGSSDDVVMVSEADEVEKNISNLFNGDDGVVSNSSADASKADAGAVTSAKPDESNGNGAAAAVATSSSNEANESHDLVSILTGTDKPDDATQISSSAAGKAEVGAVAAQKAAAKEPVSSAPDTQQTAATVEAVESAVDSESGVADKTAKKEVISSHSSTANEKLTVSGMFVGRCSFGGIFPIDKN